MNSDSLLRASEPLLSVVGLTKRFDALVATDSLSLDVIEGELHAIIGPNGAGKTTLISQLDGQIRPDSGKVYFAGADIINLPMYRRSHIGFARTFQISSLFMDMSVVDNVALAVQAHSGHSFRFWAKARHDAALRAPALAALERVDMAGCAQTPVSALSHGERRLLELAIALAGAPRLLLLDEPMAGLGPEESARMVERLRALKGRHTILLVEHDMEAVFALADRITVLVYGRSLATGTPSEVRLNPVVRDAYLGESDASVQEIAGVSD
jgi:branched-chain amino acid transport system ATP-binding protein